MRTIAVCVFVLSWFFIAFRRMPVLPLGRTTGTMLGAVLMVVFGVLTPEAAYKAVDHNTIVLLLAMMMLTFWLTRGDTFQALGDRVLRAAGTPWRLLVGLSLLSGGLSAVLVNDTVCVFLTPFVVETCRRSGLPMGPYLIALATSANLGSAATLVGNPQNMIIGSQSGMHFTLFLLRALPGVAMAFVAHLKVLEVFYRRKLPMRFAEMPPAASVSWRPTLGVWVTMGVLVGFILGFHMGFTALCGVLLLAIADRKEPLEAFLRVDWTLLLFFASLFVVVGGLHETGLVKDLLAQAAPGFILESWKGQGLFTAVLVVGSNLVSNVPMVLLASPIVQTLRDPDLAWVELAFVTTVAGNLTLVGSVANLIVAEGARGSYDLGFFEYLKFGLVTTLVTLAVGIPWLILTAWFLG